MILFTILFSLFTSLAFATDKMDEFIPAHAADQIQITTDSMLYEELQFKAIAKWHTSKDQLRTAELKRDQFKREFEIMKKLATGGQASDSQLQNAALNFQNSESNVYRYKGEVQKAKSGAMINKMRLLEKGNPGRDHRKEVVQAIHDSLLIERENMRSALDSALMTLDYHETRVKNGKLLLDRKVISRLEYDRRVLDLESAKDQTQAARNDILGVDAALKGSEESQKKLE